MKAQGIVTGIGSRSVQVAVDGFGEVRCTLRGHLWGRDEDQSKPLAVGDRVTITLRREAGDPSGSAEPSGAVESVAPRRNELTRPAAGRRRSSRQVLAANLDRIVVVAALADPPFRPGLVDRFLVATAVHDVPAVLCLNKIDLPGDRGVLAPYRDAGLPVLETSTTDGRGLDELAALLGSGVSLLVGHSGVGKSSLINAVSPSHALATGAVADHGRGRHTTTRVTLLPLDGGGFVVDSPGIREFGLADVEPAWAARLFPGFGALPDACRFNDCLHKAEPGCAVRAAAESGALPAERYASYLRMLEELDQPVQW